MRVEMFKKKKKDSYYGGKTFEKKYFSNCLHKYLTNGPKVEEILHMAYNLTKKKKPRAKPSKSNRMFSIY